jgi:hypothetical protein
MIDAGVNPLIRPKSKGDTYGLFIAGSSLRSATVGGMLAALEVSGQSKAIDLVVCESAGSFSGAYLLGGVAAEGATGYWRVMPEFVGSGRFAYWPRALIGRPILDVAAVIDEVFTRSVTPIPWESVVASPLNARGAYYIQVMDAFTGKPLYLRSFKTVRALKTGISAACWLPLLAGLSPFEIAKPIRDELEVLDHDLQPVVGDVLHVFDGGVCDYHMLRARSLLAPTVSVHLNPLHPALFPIQMPRFGWLDELIARIFLRRYPATIAAYVENILGGARVRQSNGLIDEAREHPDKVLVVHPREPVNVTVRQSSARAFHRAVIAGWEGAKRALCVPDLQPPDYWAHEAPAGSQVCEEAAEGREPRPAAP